MSCIRQRRRWGASGYDARARVSRIGFSPNGWRHALQASEPFVEVGLIGKAAVQRDLAERLLRAQHQLLCALASAPDDIGVRRLSEALAESQAEMSHAQAGDFGQIATPDSACQLLLDERFKLSHRSGWQAALQRLRRVAPGRPSRFA